MVVVGSWVSDQVDRGLLTEVVAHEGSSTEAEPLHPLHASGSPVGSHSSGGGENRSDTKGHDEGLKTKTAVSTLSLEESGVGEEELLWGLDDLVSGGVNLVNILPPSEVVHVNHSKSEICGVGVRHFLIYIYY